MTQDEFVKQQYNDWIANETPISNIDEFELKERIVSELSQISTMDVKEYTLFQKWAEIQDRYPTIIVNELFEGPRKVIKDHTQQRLIEKIKRNIWIPNSIEDYLNLHPELIFCDDNSQIWNCFRTFISTQKNNSNIGRNLNFIVQDKVTKKYLGVICISSDFMDLTARDTYIGWSREHKTYSGKLNHIAICSTIVPTQPFGYNYVGGKLLSLLCLSDTIQEIWKKKYKNTLVGLSTTSLYGNTKDQGLSQYDNLKFWKKMGFSKGSISFEPKKETLKVLFSWVRLNYPEKYFRYFVARTLSDQPLVRQYKDRAIKFAFSKLQIPKELTFTKHFRGIYFAELYDNTKAFLNGSEEPLVKSFDTSVEYLTELWKQKYAKRRIESLIKNNRVSNEILFYDDIIFKDWNETKETYLNQVGR